MIVLAWLALVVPGLVFVVSRCRETLEGGLLPTLALAWSCSFTAYFLLSLPCFLFGWSVDAFAVAVVLTFVWAVVESVRRRLHERCGPLLRDLLGVEVVVVIAAVWGFARIGTRITGDALVHVTRIRQLLDAGMVNSDPWVAGDHFFSLYHTNLIHSLHAVVTRLSGYHFLEVWRASAGLACLLTICGGAWLAWSLHRSRWAAWGGGLGGLVAVASGATSFLALPNKLAPFFCVPMAVGIALTTFLRAPDRKKTWPLAAAIGVTSATHALYGVFLAVLLGPLLLVNVVRAWRTDRPTLRASVLLAMTLLAAVPMPLVSQLTKAEWDSTAPKSAAKGTPGAPRGTPAKRKRARRKRIVPPTTKARPDRFIETADDTYIVDPFVGFGGHGGYKKLWLGGIRYVMLAGALALGLLGRRRREIAALAIVLVSGSLVLFVPYLCTAFASLTGARWTLLRFATAFFPLSLVAALAGAAALGDHRLRIHWLRGLATALVVALVLFAWGRPHLNAWRKNIDTARKGVIALPQRDIDMVVRQREALSEYVPPGSTVLIDLRGGMELVRIHDVHILAPRRASLGVPGLNRLRRLNQNLIHADMPWPRRAKKLRELGIRFFIPLSYPEWARGHVRNDIRDQRLGFVLLELDLDS